MPSHPILYPLYELKAAGGTTIELSADKAKVMTLFSSSTYPRQVWQLDQTGRKHCIASSLTFPPPRV